MLTLPPAFKVKKAFLLAGWLTFNHIVHNNQHLVEPFEVVGAGHAREKHEIH